MKILVAGRDPGFWRESLGAAGIQDADVSAAGTLTEAVRAIRRRQPDLVLLDLDLDGRDRLETLDLVREIAEGAVIAFAVTDDESISVKSLRRGADDFLAKDDLCPACLRDAVSHSLARRSIRVIDKRFHSRLEAVGAA